MTNWVLFVSHRALDLHKKSHCKLEIEKVSNIIFLNISGINNLYNIDLNKKLMKQFSENNLFFCLVETWSYDSALRLPTFLDDYFYFHVNAKKISKFGRPSGGIVFLYKKKLHSNLAIIDKTDLWILVKFNYENKIFIIGCVYWSPSVSIDTCSELFINKFNNIKEMLPSDTVYIIMGDFNCRIGTEDTVEEQVFLNSTLEYPRTSLDKVLNKRGKVLLEMMENLNLEVCNGRTKSDRPGSFTFMSPVGKSVIDLALVNVLGVEVVEDLAVTSLCDFTDHEALLLEVNCWNTGITRSVEGNVADSRDSY